MNSESVLENAPCGFISFYPNGTIVQINQTLLTWLHCVTEEVVLKKRFQDIISKGGRLYFQMYVFPLLNLQGFVNEISLDLFSSDSTNISCLFNASFIKQEDGSPPLIQAILFNITDRKKYEVEVFKAKVQAEEEKKRFQFLANTLPSILWTALPSGKINFINGRFFEYFKVANQEPGFMFLRHVLFPEDFNLTAASCKSAMKEEKEVQWELRLKNHENEYRWFFVRVIPCKDSKGKLSMWLGSCTDIHFQKEKQLRILNGLNTELSNASSIVEHKSKILREMAFDQSHLVRSPLSKIIGLISLLNLLEVDEETKFLVSLITESVSQLDTVITEIRKI